MRPIRSRLARALAIATFVTFSLQVSVALADDPVVSDPTAPDPVAEPAVADPIAEPAVADPIAEPAAPAAEPAPAPESVPEDPGFGDELPGLPESPGDIVPTTPEDPGFGG
jgi:hypothetical protein